MTTEDSGDDLENRVSELESQIKEIQLRNRRVEANKAWETSLTRILVITMITYLAAVMVFFLIGSKKCWLDALIPSGAYLLSVQTLPLFKSKWIERIMESNKEVS